METLSKKGKTINYNSTISQEVNDMKKHLSTRKREC